MPMHDAQKARLLQEPRVDRESSDGDSAAPKLSDCAIDQGVADLAVQQALGGLFFDIGTW
jgi:hypothetical protein